MTDSGGEKKFFLCKCTGNAFIASDTARLEFFWPGPAPRPGQFFLIKPGHSGVFLARPVSVAGWEQRKTGGGGILRFLVAQRGRGSREITEMGIGDEAGLTGPLGNFWPVDNINVNNNADNNDGIKGPAALVAGGIGIAPLLSLAAALGEKHGESGDPAFDFDFDFYAGFKSGPFGLDGLKPRALVIATEDGSEGWKGRITDFFKPSGYGVVFACGPEAMLKTLALMCKDAATPCYISMEKHMACGVGACLGCTVKTAGGNKRCCADGPVFNAGEIDFGE